MLPTSDKCKFSSFVLTSIFNHYQRRSDTNSSRVIGCLLGLVSPVSSDGNERTTIVGDTHQYFALVLNCFPVPHSENGDQVSINNDHFRSFLGQYQKMHPKTPILLGYYSCSFLRENSNTLSYEKNSSFIEDFFVQEIGLSGAPVTLHLKAFIEADGNLSIDVFSLDSVTARMGGTKGVQSKASRETLRVPWEVKYNVQDSFLLNLITHSLSNDALHKKSANGKLLVQLGNGLQKSFASWMSSQLHDAISRPNLVKGDHDEGGDGELESALKNLKTTMADFDNQELNVMLRKLLPQLEVELHTIEKTMSLNSSKESSASKSGEN